MGLNYSLRGRKILREHNPRSPMFLRVPTCRLPYLKILYETLKKSGGGQIRTSYSRGGEGDAAISWCVQENP